MQVGSATITNHWRDNDSAIYIAEVNGGSDFRKNYPDFSISAVLGQPLVPNPSTDWWITYRCMSKPSKSLLVGIDACPGSVVIPANLRLVNLGQEEHFSPVLQSSK